MKKKTEKREQAIERKEKYDSLSIPERIELAKSRRGKSAKEIARLTQGGKDE